MCSCQSEASRHEHQSALIATQFHHTSPQTSLCKRVCVMRERAATAVETASEHATGRDQAKIEDGDEKKESRISAHHVFDSDGVSAVHTVSQCNWSGRWFTHVRVAVMMLNDRKLRQRERGGGRHLQNRDHWCPMIEDDRRRPSLLLFRRQQQIRIDDDDDACENEGQKVRELLSVIGVSEVRERAFFLTTEETLSTDSELGAKRRLQSWGEVSRNDRRVGEQLCSRVLQSLALRRTGDSGSDVRSLTSVTPAPASPPSPQLPPPHARRM